MGILRKYNNPVLGLSVSLIWVSRLFTFLAYPTPINAPDSGTYYTGNFLDFSLVSFGGHAARGWVVPLAYSLMPSKSVLELFQLLLSGFAWTVLLFTVFKARIVSDKLNYCVLIIIAALGSSVQIIQHDTAVLATSITNSLFIILLTILISIRHKVHQVKLILVILLTTLLSIQKITFIFVGIGAIFLSFILIRKQLNMKVKTVFLVISITGGVFSGYVSANVNTSWQVSYSGQTLLWQLGGQSPVAREFTKYIRSTGAPDCVTQEAPFMNLDTSIGKILNECPESKKYLQNSIQKDFLRFAATNPMAILKLGIFGFGATLTDSASNYGNAVSIIPRGLSGFFFGETSPNLVNSSQIESQVAGLNFLESGAAFWLYAPMIFWMLLGVCGSLIGRERRKTTFHLLAIMFGCLFQSLLVVVLLPSEWVRQTSPFIIGVLIVSIILTFKLIETISLSTTNFDKEIAN